MGMRTTRRHALKTGARSALAIAALPSALASLAGCARTTAPLQVVALWSGAELNAFRAVLAGFTRATGHRVDVISVGEQIDPVVRARSRAHNPPDVAVVSRPSWVADYVEQGWLTELDPRLGAGFPQVWRDLVTIGGRMYGVWIKAAHKSLFWYRPSVLAQPAPAVWSDLVALIRRMAAAGQPPLALGAADGWVLTDWFDNVLLSIAGGPMYEALARGEGDWSSVPVRQALTHLADVWATPGAFPGGPQRALLTQFAESVLDVFVTQRAGMVFEGDFVAAVFESARQAGRVQEPAQSFPFPAISSDPPLVVGGDVAVLMKDSPAGRELMAWLAQPHATLPWIDRGGFLSPNQDVPISAYPPGRTQELIGQLRAAEGQLHFDLSDRLRGVFTGGDGLGIWLLLQDFFAEVTRAGADIPAVVDWTARRLAEAAQRSRLA
jgi:ABC-type glycerol-3-phosphate transport system substrate-binding protein